MQTDSVVSELEEETGSILLCGERDARSLPGNLVIDRSSVAELRNEFDDYPLDAGSKFLESRLQAKRMFVQWRT